MRQNFETLKRKWIEYLLEIIVIVVGILVAFGLNSWNERRTASLQERTMLLSIQSEFIENQKKLEQIISNHREISDGCKTFVSLCKPNPELISEVDLRNLIRSILWIPVYSPDKGAISSVISSGNISLIKNDKLKYLINSWSGKVEHYEYGESNIRNHVINGIIPTITRYYPIQNLQMINSLDYSPGDVNDTSPFQYDQKLIFSDLELVNNVELKKTDTETAWTRANELK